MRKSLVFFIFIVILTCQVWAGKALLLKNTFTGQETQIPLVEENGVPYISLYSLSTFCGIDYTLDRITRKAVIKHEKDLFQIMPENAYVSMNDNLFHCDQNPFFKDGTVFLSLSTATSVLEKFGFLQIKYSIQNCEDRKVPALAMDQDRDQNDPGSGLEQKKQDGTDILKVQRTKNETGFFSKDIYMPSEGKNCLKFIVLDPGHGGYDPGGIGLTGLREKIVVLKVAQMVHTILQTELPGVDIIMSRDNNEFISLSDRSKMASELQKKEKNGIFISIHANISRNKSVYGYETYVLSENPSDDESRILAALENGVFENDGKGPDVVSKVLSKMLDTELIRQSRALAESVMAGYDNHISDVSANRGVRGARFYVLEGTTMPGILTEIGYLSNGQEEERMRSDEYLKSVARSIADGIINFAKYYNVNNGFS